MPSTPTSFGALTYQGSHASYHGTQMMLTSPGGYYQGSPCYGQAMQPPMVITFANPYPQAPSPVSPNLCTMPAPTNVAPPEVDAMRSWLAGGVMSNDADLAMRLQEAVPETYED